MEQAQHIIKWLKKRDLISINALEKKCGMSPTTLSQALRGLRPIPSKYISAIVNTLKDYGYTKPE